MTVVAFRGSREPPRSERSQMETRILTIEQVSQWKIPMFQRPVRINAKVQALAAEISQNGGIIDGVITVGTVKNDPATYVVDGQHRLEAARISGATEIMADFRLVRFESMSEMADEFVRLNSALVRMRPDDILRGLESSTPALRKIRSECKFVGYDQIRRGTSSPIVGMSMLLKVWQGSLFETPVQSGYSDCSAPSIISRLDADSVEDLIQFLTVALAAWGRDAEYARLWGSLNLGLCMWCWRRLVKDTDRGGNKRYSHLTIKQFTKCLMGLSADSGYLDWLQGRQLRDRDRGPAYARIKKIFSRRLTEEGSGKLTFPAPAWVTK